MGKHQPCTASNALINSHLLKKRQEYLAGGYRWYKLESYKMSENQSTHVKSSQFVITLCPTLPNSYPRREVKLSLPAVSTTSKRCTAQVLGRNHHWMILAGFFLVERGWHTEPNQVNRSRIVGFGMTRVPMQRPSKTHSQSVTNQATVNNS